jgi:4-hydroxy-3-methylbut-2-en-1-yl diphosphate synthase IspG/GcpE
VSTRSPASEVLLLPSDAPAPPPLPSGLGAQPSTEDKPRAPGKVETRVRADIAHLGITDAGFSQSYAEIALALARALDRADTEEDIGKIAQVSLQLRQTLSGMVQVGDDGEAAKQIFEHMRTPVSACPHCGRMPSE